MTTHCLGFFLGGIESDVDSFDLYLFACFSPDTNEPRQVLKLRSSTGLFVAELGELFIVASRDEGIFENAWCEFEKIDEPPYIHESGMIHTHEKVFVSESDKISAEVYEHSELGKMVDKHSLCVPGFYRTITFKIIPTDKTFTIEVLQADRSLRGFSGPGSNRFEMIGRVLQVEKDELQLRENERWGAIGHLKLITFDNTSFFEGTCPIFELVDNRFTDIFQKKLTSGARVLMIPLAKNEEGEWEDVTYEKCTGLRGSVLPVENEKNMCVVRMNSGFEKIVRMKVGDMYRFEMDISIDDVAFWKERKHVHSELFQHTEDGEEELDMLEILDARVMESGESFRDKQVNMDKLNKIQSKALAMAQNENRKLVCIQGPPGTGKSLVLATYIVSLVKKGKSAVVMAPTREALFNLKQITENMLKECKVNAHRDALMDIWTFEDRMDKTEAAQNGIMRLNKWRKQLKMKKVNDEEFVNLQRKLIRLARLEGMKEICPNVKIVFSTICSAFARSIINSQQFTPSVCIIDEASQVMEAHQWPACFAMQRIVMAGDPHQLPAVVFSDEARSFELQKSVMDRIMEKKEKFSWIMLETQYRCHKDIISWSNDTFYEGDLKHASDGKSLKNLITKNIPPNNISRVYDPMVMIDTSMLNQDDELAVKCYETFVQAGNNSNYIVSDVTYANEGEAEIVIDHVKHLLNMGVEKDTIAIITPYRGQQELLRKMVTEQELGIGNIGTVDAYQGQEFDIVVFSMVRSNPAIRIGFVNDLRRLNVAITRAKYHFCFVGNAYMLYTKGRIKPELRNLVKCFMDSTHKFPPSFAKQIFTPFNIRKMPIYNNFGTNYNAFKKFTKDPTMIRYIEEWQEKREWKE